MDRAEAEKASWTAEARALRERAELAERKALRTEAAEQEKDRLAVENLAYKGKWSACSRRPRINGQRGRRSF